MNGVTKSETRSFQTFAWVRTVALEVVGEIDEGVVAAIVVSVDPSPDHDVDLQIYDSKTSFSKVLKLRTAERDLNDEAGREDEVRNWMIGVRDIIKKRRMGLPEWP